MRSEDYRAAVAHLKPGIKRYVEHGIQMGDFLTAVFENNLMEAFGRADEHNREIIYELCAYIYNDLPMGCHGSHELVKEWIKAGGWRGMGIKAEL